MAILQHNFELERGQRMHAKQCMRHGRTGCARAAAGVERSHELHEVTRLALDRPRHHNVLAALAQRHLWRFGLLLAAPLCAAAAALGRQRASLCGTVSQQVAHFVVVYL